MMNARQWQWLGVALGSGDRRSLACWGAGSALAALAVITVLKQAFRRDLTPVAAGAWYEFSFPSGHTIGAAAALGMLVLLAAQRRVDRLGLRGPSARPAWVVAVGAWSALVVLTGVGRILTQKHWVSDVVASWGVGVALACGTLLLARIPAEPNTHASHVDPAPELGFEPRSEP